MNLAYNGFTLLEKRDVPNILNFLLGNSHLQAYYLQVKSRYAVHTLGSHCVYISEIFKPYHLPRRVKLEKYVLS